MMEKTPTFLVLVPEEVKEITAALRYAALQARGMHGRVALLSIVEPEEIGAWGGVDKVMTDDAFNRARKVSSHYATYVKEHSGAEALALFRKGRRREALLEAIASEPDISALVLTAHTGESASNPLVQYLTSEKGIKKLSIPLIVVPEMTDVRDQ